jgi:DNA-directed RNA polymerase subunit E'/Rpb7
MAESFPLIQTVLDESKYIPGYEEEIDELSDEKKIKLQREENDDLERFRFSILKLYDENSKMIKGPYVADIENLKKEIKRIQKIHKEAILEIRKRHIKEKNKPVMEPSIMPMKPGFGSSYRTSSSFKQDDYTARIRAGDDLKKDAKQISEEYQKKIEEAIKAMHISEKARVMAIETKFTKKRNDYWDNVASRPVPLEGIERYLNNLDLEEKNEIKTLNEQAPRIDANIRRKFIEEYNKEKERLRKVDEAEDSLATMEKGVENAAKNAIKKTDEAEDSLATMEKGVENAAKNAIKKTDEAEMSLAYAEEKGEIDDKKTYMSSMINEKITVPFNKLSNNMTRYFEGYAEKRIEGKCRNEGYVKKNSSSVISYSTGLLNSDKVIYDVVFSVDVCYPYEGMEIECKIKNITKIGIRATISELNNPIILFVSREHNPDKDFDAYKENQIIKVKVLGNRFELNDEYISVIGELI